MGKLLIQDHMYQQQQAAAGGLSNGLDHQHSSPQRQAGGGRGAPDAWAKLRALQQAAQETGFAVMYTHPEMNAPEVKDAVDRILAAQGYRVGADAGPSETPATPSQQLQPQQQQQQQAAPAAGSRMQDAAPDVQPAWGVLGDVRQLETVAAALDERGERDGALLASLQKRCVNADFIPIPPANIRAKLVVLEKGEGCSAAHQPAEAVGLRV